MGSNTSKVNAEPGISHKPDPDTDPGAYSDPRSPTPEITRTPLNNKAGSKHNITKNVDLRKTFEGTKSEEKLVHNNPILSAVIKSHLHTYDPRSPTQEFERTPIVINPKTEGIQDDNLLSRDCCGSPSLRNDDIDYDAVECQVQTEDKVAKNLCHDFLDITLDDTVNINDTEPPLGSSTASNDSIEKDISKEGAKTPKQLLETNFEYVETDIVHMDKAENIKSSDNSEHLDKLMAKFKILDSDPRSPSVGIDRTPIVVAKIDEEPTEENVEEMSDDTLIKVLQSTNAELRQTNPNQEGLMIYEDESADMNITPKKSKSTANSGSRTPLTCMRNKADPGHARSKSANTLCDPADHKVTSLKNTKRVSHIPRLKALSKQSKLSSESSLSLKNISKVVGVAGDCENTPPNSHRDCWDKDNSIVL